MRLGGGSQRTSAQEHRHTRKSVSGGALGLFPITNSLFAFREFPLLVRKFPYLVGARGGKLSEKSDLA